MNANWGRQMLEIYWNSGYAEGTTDLLPSYWFENDGTDGFRQHAMRGVDDPKIYARCSVEVKGPIVDLDYGSEHRAYNEQNGYLPGVARLIFEDESRSGKPLVEWKDEGGEEFSADDCDVTIKLRNVRVKDAAPFDPKSDKDGRKKIKQMVAIRQGQSNFRNELLAAYGGQCALTGCRVEEVLQAAHIKGYLGHDETNYVTNGLLLRADIHTLFDLGIIKIDRTYAVTAPASIVKAFKLPKKIANLPKDVAHHPSPDAFDRKWA